MIDAIKKQRRFKPKTEQSTLLESAKAFSHKERPSLQEINIFRELFYTLVAKTSPTDLEVISGVLARLPFTPRPIAMYLAMEPIEIASPFLLFSPVLNDSDLRAISESRPAEYSDIIRRRDVVSQTLVEQTDHQEGKRSKEVQKGSLKLKKETPMQPPLVKAQPVENVEITAKPKDRSSELIALANKGGRLERKKNPQPIPLMETDFESTLLALLRNGEHEKFARKLAAKTGLDGQLISDYVALDDIGQLAALYRALDIQPTISARLLLLTSQNLGRDGNIFSRIIVMFKQLNVSECQQQFIKLGADFTSKPITEANPDKPHFARLVADRRRSLQTINDGVETEQKLSTAS